MRFAFATLFAILFLTACSTATPTPPPPTTPPWDSVPPHVVESLCRRLKMDAIATSGRTALVRVTQPLVTRENLAAVAGSTPERGRKGPGHLVTTNRAIPIEVGDGTCEWRLADVRETFGSDEMVVELSAPVPNPFTRREAGLFARVSLGNEHESWYWISLVPQGDQWPVRFVSVLFK